MAKKYVTLALVFILMLFFTGSKVTAEDTTYYFMDVPKKPLQIMEELYKSVKNLELDHARKTVRMLDDIYKTYIVLITEEYVDDPSVLPAATLSKRVFKSMNKKGWHKARLLDATGTPFNPENNPRDEFERDAINAMISGRTYFEKIEKINGKVHLRVVTSVHAVMKGCISCHPSSRVGDLLGGIAYDITLDE
ncbi:MAG: c-type heme family protein [Candidatus Scalindua sp.]